MLMLVDMSGHGVKWFAWNYKSLNVSMDFKNSNVGVGELDHQVVVDTCLL